MSLNLGLFLVLQGMFCISVFSQSTTSNVKHWADSTINACYLNSSENLESALNQVDSAFTIYNSLRDTCGMIRARTLGGGYCDGLGRSELAIDYLLWSLDNFRASCDSSGLIDIYTNLSSAYLSLGSFEKAIDVCTECQEEWSSRRIASRELLKVINNKAIAYASSGDLENAERLFRRVYQDADLNGDRKMSEQSLINVGTIFTMRGILDSAFYYFGLAYKAMEESDNYDGRMDLQLNMAIMHRDLENYQKSLGFLRQYSADAITNDDLQREARAEYELSRTFELMGRLDSAYAHVQNFITLNDSLINQERIKALADVQEKYEAVKRQKEIDDLKLKNLDAALANEKVKRSRNAIYAGAGLLFILSLMLLGRYRIVNRNRNELRKKNVIINEERRRSDGLLRNILPDEVAEELKNHGKARARSYEAVSILFTDFKGFTQVSEGMSPEELVHELDICFQAFDRIIGNYGLEKIKTIGDAYMAVCGLPEPHLHEPLQMIYAAIDMQAFIANRKSELSSLGKSGFEMRLGIHTGPVVAGVVGEKKFQYDVWGDSVNTASRMESSGDVNRVNISEFTYDFVKDAPDLIFEHRGRIAAKNKGELSMYFVSKK